MRSDQVFFFSFLSNHSDKLNPHKAHHLVVLTGVECDK